MKAIQVTNHRLIAGLLGIAALGLALTIIGITRLQIDVLLFLRVGANGSAAHTELAVNDPSVQRPTPEPDAALRDNTLSDLFQELPDAPSQVATTLDTIQRLLPELLRILP